MEIVEAVVAVIQMIMMNNLNLIWNDLDLKLKEYAKEFNVPIILDEGLALLEQIIRIKKPTNILEIGTAIGYSAIRMSRVNGSFITTIERNPKMIEIAKNNFKDANLEDKIKLIECDALEAFDLVSDKKYDLIFIDAAKAQYEKFFNLYTPLLNENGIVISDNMSFHNLKDNLESQSRSVKALIRKLGNYQNFLLNNKDYDTSIFNIGDGVAISIKKD